MKGLWLTQPGLHPQPGPPLMCLSVQRLQLSRPSSTNTGREIARDFLQPVVDGCIAALWHRIVSQVEHPILERAFPFPLRSSLPFDWLELKGKCFTGRAIGISNVGDRKLSVYMCLNGSNSRSSFDVNAATKCSEAKPNQADVPLKSDPTVEDDENTGPDLHVTRDSVLPPKRTAKIHDFCLGIPFGKLIQFLLDIFSLLPLIAGAFLFAGGLLGFVFSRNPAGIVSGSAILALSLFSLKIWRTGRSSLPFILGQAAITAALLRKHLQVYSLSKKLFPTGFVVFLSAAMICFYSYVLFSGGNPPPKKLAAAPPS